MLGAHTHIHAAAWPGVGHKEDIVSTEQGVRDKPTLRSELATVTQPSQVLSQVSLPTSPRLGRPQGSPVDQCAWC